MNAVGVRQRCWVMCDNVKIDPGIIAEGRMQAVRHVDEGKGRTVAAV